MTIWWMGGVRRALALCALVLGSTACVEARIATGGEYPSCRNGGDAGCCDALASNLRPIAENAREYFVLLGAATCVCALAFLVINVLVTRFNMARADRLGRHGLWSTFWMPVLVLCLSGPVSMAAEGAFLTVMGSVDKLTLADAQLREMVQSQVLGSGVQCFTGVAGTGEATDRTLAWAAQAAAPDERLVGHSRLVRYLVGGNAYLSAIEQATLAVPLLFRIAEPLGALLGLIIGVYLVARENHRRLPALAGVDPRLTGQHQPTYSNDVAR